MSESLSENIRLLCSYGRSVSDICRRAGINRQQFSKYLNGHSEPSLASLRKICDFFGVDESEIMMDKARFQEIIRLRPPQFNHTENRFDRVIKALTSADTPTDTFFSRHEGYYHAYIVPDPGRGHCIRSLSRIYREGDKWLARTVERQMDQLFMLPATLKYSGIVMEGCNRIAIYEREDGEGRSLNATFLYPSEHGKPRYLPGLLVGFCAEGSQQINCIRTVWQFLGKQPDLRQALKKCGVVDREQETLPAFVEQGIGNDMTADEKLFTPRF